MRVLDICLPCLPNISIFQSREEEEIPGGAQLSVSRPLPETWPGPVRLLSISLDHQQQVSLSLSLSLSVITDKLTLLHPSSETL